MKNYPKFRFVLCASLFVLASCQKSATEEEALVAIHIQDRNGITETVSHPARLATYEHSDFLSPQPYKKVLRVFKKGGKSHSLITTYHPNGSLFQYLEVEEMRAHGFYREWFPNGKLRIEARVLGGTADVAAGSQKDWIFEGVNSVWDQEGNLMAEISYEKGVLQGKSLSYYPSGRLEKELPYTQNALSGEALEYYPNGQLKSKTSYRDGVKEGESIGYFSKGEVAWIEEYEKGLLKEGRYFDRDHKTLSGVEGGRGFQAIFQDDLFIRLVEIRRGSPEGAVQNFTSEGVLQSMFHLKNGKREGEEIEYYLPSEEGEKPHPKLSIEWSDDRIHGKVKTWYPSGQLESERMFCRNEKMGEAFAWYPDGSLMLWEEYEKDLLLKGSYYKRGQKEAVSQVLKGAGTALFYDEKGIFLRKVIYANGKPVDDEK